MVRAFSDWLMKPTPMIPNAGNSRPLQLLWEAMKAPDRIAVKVYSTFIPQFVSI